MYWCLALIAMLFMHVESRPGKLLPRDDASHDAGLAKLRQGLLRAAAAQDVQLLMPFLADTVTVDFMGVTRERFSELLASYGSSQKLFWRDLRDALELGMAPDPHDAHAMCAPYVYPGLSALENGDSLYAITGKDVQVRSEPSLTASVIDTLSYDIVERGDDADRNETQVGDDLYLWRNVVTPAHRQGWVLTKYLRGLLGPRYWFKKIHGEWKLVVITRDGD